MQATRAMMSTKPPLALVVRVTHTQLTFIDLEAGSYTLYTSAQGFVSVMNDLHKGRNTGTVWKLY